MQIARSTPVNIPPEEGVEYVKGRTQKLDVTFKGKSRETFRNQSQRTAQHSQKQAEPRLTCTTGYQP